MSDRAESAVDRDWIGSGVSIGWLSSAEALPRDLEEQVDRAWQELFHDVGWPEWMTAHADVLYDPAVLVVMWMEDRDDLRSRHTARTLSYYVPARSFFPPADVREVARELIHGIYTKRAAKAGIPPPPPV